MRYLIIADWDENFNPTAINHTETEAEAQALVNKLINDMSPGNEAPDAFYAVDPKVSAEFIIVDPDTKTLSIDESKVAFDTWKKMMEESDKIDLPRWLEDHIELEHGGVSAGRQDAYNTKKTKRGQKPT